jgi:hypothetical protein
VFNAKESTSDEERRAVEEVTDRLLVRFPDVPPDSVRDVVIATWADFNGRPIRAFVPVLVERTARQQLASSAESE